MTTQNVLAKFAYLSDLFNEIDGLQEVYSDHFDLSGTEAKLYLYATKYLPYSKILDLLHNAFPTKLNLYITYEPMHSSLANKDLIWRLGRWYYDY